MTDELNAFKVFETLNARGVRLSATDLLKNYLFSVISKEGTHSSELKTLEERWESIIGLLGSDNFPEFLRVFWNSGHKLVRKAHLFKTIRQAVPDRGQAFALIRDLDRHARIYAALRNPLDTSWERDERNWLQQLQMFNVRQPLSLLLVAFDRFGDADRSNFKQTLRAVTMLSFRYNVICGLPGNELERVYNAIAIRLTEERSPLPERLSQSFSPSIPKIKFSNPPLLINLYAQATAETGRLSVISCSSWNAAVPRQAMPWTTLPIPLNTSCRSILNRAGMPLMTANTRTASISWAI